MAGVRVGVVTAGALLGCLLGSGSALAAPPDPQQPPITVVPGDSQGTSAAPSVDIGVRDAGGPGGRGSPGRAGAAAGGRPVCGWRLVPEVEAWVRRLPSRLPAGGSDRVDPRSRLYARVCGGVEQGFAWFGPGAAGGQALQPAPDELARQAAAQLRLPLPTAGHSPDLTLRDGRHAVLVGEYTWVWTASSRFEPRTRRLQVGPVWAVVTATPVELTFDPGNGDWPVSCLGPGTPFVAGRYAPHSPSPSCGYQYQRSSAGVAGQMVTAEYGIRWRVSWVGSTGSAPAAGQLEDLTSRATTQFVVAEAQALITG